MSVTPHPSAGPAELAAWADEHMASREPDFVIGDNYLRRWWVVPRNPMLNVYLHDIRRSDDDRALHDHPWDNTSLLLAGCYYEHASDGSVTLRTAGDVVNRKATDAHRLEVIPGKRAISLFVTGPIVREWGFHCPKGWRHWTEFVDARDKGQVGRGCTDWPYCG